MHARGEGFEVAGEQQAQLFTMASTWDNLAAERASLVLRYPELAFKGELEEETGSPRGD